MKPTTTSETRYEVSLFGPIQVTKIEAISTNDGEVREQRTPLLQRTVEPERPSDRFILALLIIRELARQHPIHRDLQFADAPENRKRLAELLWSKPTDEALTNLKSRLGKMRNVFGRECLPPSGHLPPKINLDRFSVDYERLITKLEQPDDEALLAIEPEVCTGTLLQDCPHAWADDARKEAQRLAQQMLIRLTRYALDLGEHERAERFFRKAFADEPSTALPDFRKLISRLMQMLARISERDRLANLYIDFAGVFNEADRSLFDDEYATWWQEVHTPRTNLQLGRAIPFFERKEEAHEVKRLLLDKRFVTIWGMGGSGKTQLSIQVAEELSPCYPADRDIVMVRVEDCRTPDQLIREVARTLEVHEERNIALEESIIERLQQRHMLLILDSCDHVVKGAARIIRRLLPVCMQLRILATSRENIELDAPFMNTHFALPLLSVPHTQQDNCGEEHLDRYAAIGFFLLYVRAREIEFELTSNNARQVTDICRRLEGIPLALTLAASYAGNIHTLAAGLEKRFATLVSGLDAPERHATLKATLAWSYEMPSLSQAEAKPLQMLLQALSVFSGGCTFQAVEEVCKDTDLAGRNLLFLLRQLGKKSFVQDVYGNGSRYALLDTIREYAKEKLVESGEILLRQQAHADYYLSFVHQQYDDYYGPKHHEAMGNIHCELNNIRTALDFVIVSGESEKTLEFVKILQRFWWTRGDISEGVNYSKAALNLSETQKPSEAKALVLNGAGVLVQMQGDLDEARKLVNEALTMSDGLGFDKGMGAALGNLSEIAMERGDLSNARELTERSLQMVRQRGDDDWHEALCLVALGQVEYESENLDAAKLLGSQGLAIVEKIGDRRQAAKYEMFLGQVHEAMGNLTEARSYYERGLDVLERLGDHRTRALSLTVLGQLLIIQGDLENARRDLTAALAICREFKYLYCLVSGLEAMGSLAAVRSERKADLYHAVRLYAAATTLRKRTNLAASPHQRRIHDIHIADLKRILAVEDFQREWSEGEQMTWQQATEYAISMPVGGNDV